MNRLKIMAFLALILLLVACSHKLRAPDLSGLYNRAARYHDQTRNPVILIPGILGSKLIESGTGRVVWGEFAGNYANPTKPEGARLFSIPMKMGAPLKELRDSVVSIGTLDRVRVKLLGLPLNINAYFQILDALGIGGYRDESGVLGQIDYGKEHFTCFQFDYDWRLDNVENARRLHQFILRKRAYVQSEYAKRFGVENYDVKFDIVAHSMGGLIARYYLRYGDADLPEDGGTPTVTWAGTRYVDKVVLVAPPNAGSAEALLQLVRGRKIGPLLPKYEPAVLGTLPSLYELLPRDRHHPLVDAANPRRPISGLYDPDLWIRFGWGLASRNQDKVLQMLLPNVSGAKERRAIALDHLRKCLSRAEQFEAALDVPADPPPNISISLIAGDATPTPRVIAVNKSDGSVEVVEDGPGDGEVLRTSALMDERATGVWLPRVNSPIHWKNVLFLFSDHLELTRDPVFTDNILYLLLEQPL